MTSQHVSVSPQPVLPGFEAIPCVEVSLAADGSVSPQPVLPGFEAPVFYAGETLDERADKWIAANPWVLDALERLALDHISTGVKRIGVKALVERLRWDWEQYRTTGDRWKLNNSYTSRLARRLIERQPILKNYIQTRKLTT